MLYLCIIGWYISWYLIYYGGFCFIFIIWFFFILVNFGLKYVFIIGVRLFLRVDIVKLYVDVDNYENSKIF